MSTQTENLGLHQWESTDPFLREDFNEDNRRIDRTAGELTAAIAAIPLEKIASYTLEADSEGMTIQLPDVDWTPYQSLRVVWRVGGAIQGSVFMRVNGDETERYYYSQAGNTTGQDKRSYVRIGTISPYENGYRGGGYLTMFRSADDVTGGVVFHSNYPSGEVGVFAIQGIPMDDLTSITIFTDKTSGTNETTKAGSTIAVYGLR